MRGTPKGFEWLRGNGHSLPPPRGPIPLIKGKCPEGTKGIGKVAPKGPDEGGYRWVRRPSNGRMGTSAPTQGYDRFRRGRCPQRPVDNGCTPVVPLIRHGCAMPPSPLRGEGFGRSVGSAQMSMAFPSSVTAYAVPPSPRGRLFVSYPRSRCRGGYDPPGIPPLGLLAMTGFLTVSDIKKQPPGAVFLCLNCYLIS